MSMSQISRWRAVVVAGAVAFVLWGCSGSGSEEVRETKSVDRYFDTTGNPVAPENREPVGTSSLVRRPDGLVLSARVEDLLPGGVYSLWMVVTEGDEGFGGGIFNTGGGVIVGEDGVAEIEVSASLGDPGIVGFYVEGEGEVTFGTLDFPMTAPVRLEVAYHGQAEDAGDDLDAWLADFWSGTPGICPSPRGTVNTGAIPSQPYCPAFFVAEYDGRG